MYRQVGFELVDEIPDQMVPLHVREALEEEIKLQEKEDAEKRERMNQVNVKIWYKGVDKTTTMKQTDTLK